MTMAAARQPLLFLGSVNTRSTPNKNFGRVEPQSSVANFDLGQHDGSRISAKARRATPWGVLIRLHAKARKVHRENSEIFEMMPGVNVIALHKKSTRPQEAPDHRHMACPISGCLSTATIRKYEIGVLFIDVTPFHGKCALKNLTQ
ncbi:hypothetical protein [Hartmannibacter diazotrophicus]|uniref:hypothetical protein n=1 Tax=Hartmannibacter diazotrophicus TaxID=1482074 RepID=UPI0012FD0526|nr:hypothetical protein [Hartmannibacter diazotrophicus]